MMGPDVRVMHFKTEKEAASQEIMMTFGSWHRPGSRICPRASQNTLPLEPRDTGFRLLASGVGREYICVVSSLPRNTLCPHKKLEHFAGERQEGGEGPRSRPVTSQEPRPLPPCQETPSQPPPPPPLPKIPVSPGNAGFFRIQQSAGISCDPS